MEISKTKYLVLLCGYRRHSLDITYIQTNESWLYLAVLIDLYSRAIVRPEQRLKPPPFRRSVLSASLKLRIKHGARMEYRYGSHTVYKIQYHFVFVMKYRYLVTY
jgi:hypothetical protein